MKAFKGDGGPATKARPYLTALGGVLAYPTNPVAWGVDPVCGCFPWPHQYDDQPQEEFEDGPPPSMWTASGPSAAFAGAPGQLTSGGGSTAAPAPTAKPAPSVGGNPGGLTVTGGAAPAPRRGWGLK